MPGSEKISEDCPELVAFGLSPEIEVCQEGEGMRGHPRQRPAPPGRPEVTQEHLHLVTLKDMCKAGQGSRDRARRLVLWDDKLAG